MPTNRETRKVYILLTGLPDPTSRLIKLFTWYRYSHASLGLEEDRNTFYSFAGKGYIIEKITHFLRPGRAPFPCVLYELEVPAAAYVQISDIVHAFAARKNELSYTLFGAIMCVARLGYWRSDHYFCSQFVAQTLSDSGAAHLAKSSALYLPSDLTKLEGTHKIFSGDLLGLARHCHLLSM